MGLRSMPDEHGKDPPRTPRAAVLLRVLAAACAAAALWFSWNAWCIHEANIEDEDRMAHLQAYAEAVPEEPAVVAAGLSQPPTSSAGPGSAEADAAPAVADPSDPEPVFRGVPAGAAVVDFDAVLEEAPDTRAWIRIPGTNIHYPIVQAKDNEFYLTHGPDGAQSRSGAIFLSAACGADFEDTNTILYGHRMNSGTMFAQLHSFADKTFLDDHPYIYISMPDGAVRTYVVFCVQKVAAQGNDPACRTTFASSAEARAWLERPRTGVLSARQLRSGGTDPKVLTLSTCCRGDEDVRLVVQACFLREDRLQDERRSN